MKRKIRITALLVTFAMTFASAGAFADNIEAPESSDEMSVQIEETAQPEPTDDETASTPSPEPSDKSDAADAPAETPADEKNTTNAAPVSSSINIRVDMDERMSVIDSVAVFELCTSDGETLGRAEEWVGGITESLNMHFEVPEYKIGEEFILKLVSGLRSLTYNDSKIENGGEFLLNTYCYSDENGETVIGDSFILSGEPEFEKAVVVYIEGEQQDFYPVARIVDGTAMAPVMLLGDALKVKTKYDPDYDSVACTVGSDAVYFNGGTSYTTAFGNDFYAPHISCYIDDAFYVPIRTFAECFETGIDVYDFYDHIDICLGESAKVREFRNSSPVNKNGITSRTKNLIWVSKSEFTVRVYEGSQYNWELINSFPCGIGAYGTPTITGQFEYIERIRSWDYNTYYVGPVLRFHNGYAIHSTLLYYGGGEYDGRVGVHISHGCIRCHPEDINWLDRTVSLGTRIYITE